MSLAIEPIIVPAKIAELTAIQKSLQTEKVFEEEKYFETKYFEQKNFEQKQFEEKKKLEEQKFNHGVKAANKELLLIGAMVVAAAVAETEKHSLDQMIKLLAKEAEKQMKQAILFWSLVASFQPNERKQLSPLAVAMLNDLSEQIKSLKDAIQKLQKEHDNRVQAIVESVKKSIEQETDNVFTTVYGPKLNRLINQQNQKEFEKDFIKDNIKGIEAFLIDYLAAQQKHIQGFENDISFSQGKSQILTESIADSKEMIAEYQRLINDLNNEINKTTDPNKKDKMEEDIAELLSEINNERKKQRQLYSQTLNEEENQKKLIAKRDKVFKLIEGVEKHVKSEVLNYNNQLADLDVEIANLSKKQDKLQNKAIAAAKEIAILSVQEAQEKFANVFTKEEKEHKQSLEKQLNALLAQQKNILSGKVTPVQSQVLHNNFKADNSL